jgi:hypothetical protein
MLAIKFVISSRCSSFGVGHTSSVTTREDSRIVLWILVKIVVGHSLVQTGLLFRFWLCEHCATGFG